MDDGSDAAGTGTGARAFLSYARADRARAEKLAAALEIAGITIWWDAKIEGGAAFSSAIGDALEAADAVIVLWSRTSIESDWVRDEAGRGRDRGRLVPVSLDGSAPPLGFRQYHVIDLAGWRGKRTAPEIGAVARAVAAAAGRPEPAARAAPKRPSPVSRRAALAVGAVAAAGLAGGGAWLAGLFDGAAPAKSLAILPFKNLSGDPAQAFFSDGLTEEFRAALSRNAGLRIMAGTSTEAADAGGGDVRRLAEKLDVAFVLDGAVRRAGDTVRITTNLADGRTGFSRWSHSFDRKLSDIFAVQTEVAGLVAQALSVQIATAAPAPGGTRTVAAYEAYLKGRALFQAAKDEATDRASLAQYELAIAADPRFALAHAGRSRVLAGIAVGYAQAGELRGLYDAAIAAAARAVELAPELADGQLALGYATLVGRLDVAGARAAYDRAHALGQGDADVLLLFALYAVRAGRGEEARAAITRALALDPLNPRAFRAAGSIDYALRRYDMAVPHLRRALALNPKISSAQSLIGDCLIQTGRLDAARAAYAAEPSAMFRLPGLAIVEHRLGRVTEARQAMAALIAELGDAALYQQAQVLAQWGRTGPAVAALERARAVGDSGLLYLASDPMLDPLRREPRFVALIKALRLG